ncbi:uncharacterized protein LOC121746963 [Salvia splendens]|uniref:uncharacterized protein LOC121746963 n=1 Tax=Salvia splendens TaxID=180675 RepID=UPI001C26647A|nr:uncharacterized protein LOC121746963 [Salvia splendens]
MGNCIVLQENVMKKYGYQILEHNSPIKVDQHASCDEVKSMHPNVQNQMHFPIKTKKKTVRGLDRIFEGGDEGSRVARIKLVISKKELQEMLSEGGEISVDGLILKMKNHQEITDKVESSVNIGKGWFPALETIPEILN